MMFCEKTAICTMVIGDDSEKISKLSLPSIERYSRKTRSELIVYRKHNPAYKVQHFCKFDLLKSLTKFDRILYLDIDILVSNNSPNIFNEYSNSAMWPHTGANTSKQIKILNLVFDQKLDDSCHYYNTGVMLLNKEDLIRISNHICAPYYLCPDCEQSQLNSAIYKSESQIQALDCVWNYNPAYRGNAIANFYHYMNLTLSKKYSIMTEHHKELYERRDNELHNE